MYKSVAGWPRFDPGDRRGCIYLHFAICPGNCCLVKDDSSIMLSPRTYDRFIRPANERVLEALGGGCIDWCGSGQHWQAAFLDTEGLTCVDWGNPERLNLVSWEPLLRERRLPVSQMNWTAEAFLAQRPDRLFPAGAASPSTPPAWRRRAGYWIPFRIEVKWRCPPKISFGLLCRP